MEILEISSGALCPYYTMRFKGCFGPEKAKQSALGTLKSDLRIDYCGLGPFCSTPTKLRFSISLLKLLIRIIY